MSTLYTSYSFNTTRPMVKLCQASVLMVAIPAASHPPNKDDIYHTPMNEKLGEKRRGGFTHLLL